VQNRDGAWRPPLQTWHDLQIASLGKLSLNGG
jgi:hypothetical protein